MIRSSHPLRLIVPIVSALQPSLSPALASTRARRHSSDRSAAVPSAFLPGLFMENPPSAGRKRCTARGHSGHFDGNVSAPKMLKEPERWQRWVQMARPDRRGSSYGRAEPGAM
jgi:hypothetical protein